MFLCDFRLPSFPPGEVPSRASQNQHTAGLWFPPPRRRHVRFYHFHRSQTTARRAVCRLPCRVCPSHCAHWSGFLVVKRALRKETPRRIGPPYRAGRRPPSHPTRERAPPAPRESPTTLDHTYVLAGLDALLLPTHHNHGRRGCARTSMDRTVRVSMPAPLLHRWSLSTP